jgi:dihydrofolate reductase
MGYPVIMGRKTFETLPVKPLPGRVNVVVTGNKGLSYAGCVMRGSLSEAVDYCRGYDKIFVVGGQNIYEQAMKLADRIELTRIDREYDGDAFFPAIDPGKWKLEKKEENDGFSFESYVRKK